jgi:hypothetical protein
VGITQSYSLPDDGNPNYVGIIRLWKNARAEAMTGRRSPMSQMEA